MPTYSYKCELGHREDVIKPISQYDSPETCPTCQGPMHKDYSDPRWGGGGVLKAKGYFDNGLGKYIGSERDKQDAINRIHDSTGSRPIEIGDQKMDLKPRREEYHVPRDFVEAIKHG